MSKHNRRALGFIIGIGFLVLFLELLLLVNTAFCSPVPENGEIRLSASGLYSLDNIMTDASLTETITDSAENPLITKTGELCVPCSLFEGESALLPYLYIPGSGSTRLWVNGTQITAEAGKDYIAVNLHEFHRECDSIDGISVFSLKLCTQSGDGSSASGKLIFLGSQATVNRLHSAASFQRFFVIGVSFMVVLYSLSLYSEKQSEKYLLLLALLAYTNTARTLWNAIPALKTMLIPNILLLGTIKLPGATEAASFYVSYMLLKYLIAYLRFLLVREFIDFKQPSRNYLIICTVLLAVLLPFCFAGRGYFASQAFILIVHFLEILIIAFGAGSSFKVCAIFGVAWSITVSLRIFDILSTGNLIQHGMIDAGVKLQGIVETFCILAFVVAINLKFAHKYKEAEQLSISLEHMNKNLEALVAERTEELTESNRQLTSAYGQLHDIQRQKDEFMTNIIHNLKTPLFSLYGYADMAMDELEDAPGLARKHLEEINKNTSYARQLIDNLFLCMRLEDGKIKYNRMPFAVSLLLAQLDSTSRARTDAAGIKLTVLLPENDRIITADLLYIRQSLQNIVDNAVRHSAAGTEIVISTREEEKDGREYVSFRIQDHGEGIAEDEIPLIFGRYYSGGKKGATSSGLGLTITKEIIAQHGGFITVESRLGEGTCFTVSLPADESGWENESAIQTE